MDGPQTVALGLAEIVLDSVLDGDSAKGFSRFVDSVITAITAAIRTTMADPQAQELQSACVATMGGWRLGADSKRASLDAVVPQMRAVV